MKKKVLCIFVIMIMAITSISNIVFADEILTLQEKNTVKNNENPNLKKF